MEWTPHFKKKNLRLNNHIALTNEELKIIVNRDKEIFDNIEIVEPEDTGCMVDKSHSRVEGIYKVAATFAKDTIHLSGNWQVDFKKDDDLGYWYICCVKIGGVNFQASCCQ